MIKWSWFTVCFYLCLKSFFGGTASLVCGITWASPLIQERRRKWAGYQQEESTIKAGIFDTFTLFIGPSPRCSRLAMGTSLRLIIMRFFLIFLLCLWVAECSDTVWTKLEKYLIRRIEKITFFRKSYKLYI